MHVRCNHVALYRAVRLPVNWQSDLLTVLYWFRQIFSVAAGLVCGLTPFRGAVALLGCVTLRLPAL